MVRESIYAFAAVEPQKAHMASGLCSRCNTPSMSLFISDMLEAWPDWRLLLVLDGAGWHKARALPLPERLRLLHLPAYTPECNPTEHIWDEMREKGFANCFLPATIDSVEVDFKPQLYLLSADPDRLRSLTYFPWIRDGYYIFACEMMLVTSKQLNHLHRSRRQRHLPYRSRLSLQRKPFCGDSRFRQTQHLADHRV